MFRKATIVAAALIAMAGVLTGCSSPVYFGTAIVKSHHQSGKNCLATLETPDKGTAEFNVGLRARCDKLVDGGTITIQNGFDQK